MSSLLHLILSISLISLVRALLIDTGPAYILSNTAQGNGTVLYSQGEYHVVMSSIASAGDGKEWYFHYQEDDGSYQVTNKAFPGYLLDGLMTKLPYLSLAGSNLSGHYWEIDTWSDGTYQIWQKCCGSDYTLAALTDGISTNVTTGDDNLHHWALTPISATMSSAAATATSSTVISTTPRITSSTISTTTSVTHPSNSPPSQTAPASSGGLSTGGKATIGVGVSLGVIIVVIAGASFLWTKKQRLKAGGGIIESSARKGGDESYSLHPAELEARRLPVELNSN